MYLQDFFFNEFSDTESEQLWQFFSVGKFWLNVSSFLKFLIAPDSLTASTAWHATSSERDSY